jgi:hypothetical protein
MFPVFITVDTEYSSGLYRRGIATDLGANFDTTIACRGLKGEAGIHYQMDVFDRYGLKAVFFVDPMPSLVWGQEAVDRVVQPILERGHDVQLHLHTEWLDFAKEDLVGASRGQHLKNFSYDEQLILLEYAIERLMAAGAAFPVAFRAGNLGANNDSLRALATLGIRYDSSFTPAMTNSACAITLSRQTHFPCHYNGVIEVPIGSIGAYNGRQRHAQITALSQSELIAAVAHGAAHDWPSFVIISHSFEMFNRDKLRCNRILMDRFEGFCAWLQKQANIDTATFKDVVSGKVSLDPRSDDNIPAQLLPHNPLRTAYRYAEQIAGRVFY